MLSRFFLLLFLCVVTIQSAYTQTSTRTISGLVTADDSAPLEGVAISIKGTKKISGSQTDGIYYITATDKDSILVFSLPDYQTQEIRLGVSSEYNVVMHKKQPAPATVDNTATLYNCFRSLHGVSNRAWRVINLLIV